MAASTSIAARRRRCSATTRPAARSISASGAAARSTARASAIEGGSFGYLNNYAIIGGKSDTFEGAVFGSDVRGDGYISHSSFNTQTINALGTYAVTPNDRVTFKVINNWLFANLAVRQSLNQFQANPFQRGCDGCCDRRARMRHGQSVRERLFGADRCADRRAGRLPPPRFQKHRGLALGA